MPHEIQGASSTDDPAKGATTFVSAVAQIGGDHEIHAVPQVLAAAVVNFLPTLRKRLTQLLTIPAGAQGGFLQPPTASPSSRDR